MASFLQPSLNIIHNGSKLHRDSFFLYDIGVFISLSQYISAEMTRLEYVVFNVSSIVKLFTTLPLSVALSVPFMSALTCLGSRSCLTLISVSNKWSPAFPAYINPPPSLS